MTLQYYNGILYENTDMEVVHWEDFRMLISDEKIVDFIGSVLNEMNMLDKIGDLEDISYEEFKSYFVDFLNDLFRANGDIFNPLPLDDKLSRCYTHFFNMLLEYVE